MRFLKLYKKHKFCIKLRFSICNSKALSSCERKGAMHKLSSFTKRPTKPENCFVIADDLMYRKTFNFLRSTRQSHLPAFLVYLLRNYEFKYNYYLIYVSSNLLILNVALRKNVYLTIALHHPMARRCIARLE